MPTPTVVVPQSSTLLSRRLVLTVFTSNKPFGLVLDSIHYRAQLPSALPEGKTCRKTEAFRHRG